MQVNLVKNTSWFKEEKLSGFTEEVREILKSNKLLSEDRINKIINQIELRIEYITNLIKNKS